MPQQAFNIVSQEETTGFGSSNIEPRNESRFKYVYIPPKVQIALAAVAAIVSLSLIISHISKNSGGKNSWPPPGVTAEMFKDDLYDSKKSATFKFELVPKKSYRQFSKMTTTSEYDFGSSDFADSLHMMIDGILDVQDWIYEGEHEGYRIGVTFDRIAVETEDTDGDSTYYNSLAQNGDSDFDEVLETMVGDTVYIDVDDDFDLIDEEDTENTLEQLEQEFSYGTTTGLSAIDQVTQLTNLIAFLPEDSTKSYFPGDAWQIKFESDVDFEGRSTFEGYVKYNGVECAVITSFAYIDSESENVLGDDTWDIEQIDIENGKVETTMYWDVKLNIPRFALMSIEMTTEVKIGDDEFEEEGKFVGDDDDDILELPMTEVIEMYLAPY